MTTSTSAPRLPIYRLLLVGVALPGLIALVDHSLLSQQMVKGSRVFLAVVMLGWFVIQIGLLGSLCARLIQPRWLCWIIYLWCWLIVDLQTFAAWSTSSSNYSPVSLLCGSLFSAQLGMLLIWTVLGGGRWAARVPIALVLTPVLAVPFLAHGYGGDRTQLFLGQSATLLAICGVLRLQGYRLSLGALPGNSNDSSASSITQLSTSQFGMRDMLIWTTSLACLLAILRAFDLLTGTQFARFSLSESIALISAGAILAMALVVALWAALGTGSTWSRWMGLGFMCLAAGMMYFILDQLFGREGLLTPRSYFRRYPSAWDYWRSEFEQAWWKVAWIALAAGLLFASLLFLRGLGMRLNKRSEDRNLHGASAGPAVSM